MFNKSVSGLALLEHAERLADLFSLMPRVVVVALIGSLARFEDRENANDIDLVLLHVGTHPAVSFSIIRGEVYADFYGGLEKTGRFELKEGESALKRLFGECSYSIQRYIKDHVPCKVDIICANAAVLTDCVALLESSIAYGDYNFARRIFCELPLMKFNLYRGKFESGQLMHKAGLCCKPTVPWETMRKLREHRQAQWSY